MPEQKIKPQPDVADAAHAAFRKYAPELHRYLARRMRHPATAPDLTQEIFERFLQLETATHVRNIQGYLYRVASNLVQEFHEREGRSIVTFDSDVAEAASHSAEHGVVEDEADRLALAEDLRLALATLPRMHRAVLLLVKREGFSYDEVAQRTGLSVGTITQYVFEARAKMKMLLKRPG